MASYIRNGNKVVTGTLIGSAGTPGTSSELRRFTSPSRPVIVVNWDANPLYVSISDTTTNDTVYMWKIASGGTQDISLGGLLQITDLRAYFAAAGNYTNYRVYGWSE